MATHIWAIKNLEEEDFRFYLTSQIPTASPTPGMGSGAGHTTGRTLSRKATSTCFRIRYGAKNWKRRQISLGDKGEPSQEAGGVWGCSSLTSYRRPPSSKSSFAFQADKTSLRTLHVSADSDTAGVLGAGGNLFLLADDPLSLRAAFSMYFLPGRNVYTADNYYYFIIGLRANELG